MTDYCAILSGYEAWLHRVAGNLRPMGDADHDDLVQEGRIAMWRALDRYDEPRRDTLPGLLTKAAKAAMLDRVVGRRGWTGSEQPGRALGGDVLDQARDAMEREDGEPVADPAAPLDVEAVVVARDAADRALAALPRRDAAVLLLLDGYGWSSEDAAPVLDLTASRIRQIRRATLAHLGAAA